MIIRRCVLETKQGEIIEKFDASPYGGHFAGDKTTHKILQSCFIGLLYSRSILNGYNIVINVKEWAT